MDNIGDLERIDYSALQGFAESVELAGSGPQAFEADLREYGFKPREDANER